jgi:hypothetical protein
VNWRDPIRVELPWMFPARPATDEFAVPVSALRKPFAFLAVALPIAMMAVGATGAVLAAHAAERDSTEQLGTLGVELGAVLWFGGAVALGARASATVLRALALVATALAGIALVAVALVRSWTGAGLSLAMEFGVGALAVSVIDVVLLGFLHAGITRLGTERDDRVVHIRLGPSRRT